MGKIRVGEPKGRDERGVEEYVRHRFITCPVANLSHLGDHITNLGIDNMKYFVTF